MALFQIFKGNEDTLSNVSLHEGYAYFCVDSGKMFIDIASTGDVAENRIPINASAADGLLLENGAFVSTDQFVQIDDIIDVEHGGTGAASHAANTVLTGNGTSALNHISTADGAFYATTADGAPQFGTLPVAQGGTGTTTHTLNAVLTGNNANALNNVRTASGAFYATTADGVPQFGILPIAQGGTGGATAAAARSSLNVYSTDVVYTKTEVDSQVETATSIPYTATLSAANWVQSGESYTYSYTNSALRCGPNGNIPPIVTYTSNQDEYNYIDNAEATAGSGIVFTASERPESNIGIIVIDLA